MTNRATDKENTTFRLEKATLEKINFEAEQKGVSMNTIAQNILSQYFGWQAGATKAGMIPVHKTVLSLVFDKLSEQDVIKIAELFANVKVKNMLLVLRNNYSPVDFLDMFEAWLKSSSLAHTKHINHDTQVYTITHEMGNKWSIYLRHMLQTVLHNMGLKGITFESTDDTIMFRVPLLLL